MSSHLIYILVIVGLVILHFMFPEHIVEVETELIKGDTVVVIEVQTKLDTVTQYVYKATTDTLIVKDTIMYGYRSRFALGDSILGTRGEVGFYTDKFNFKDIEYIYPKETHTIVDTLKITEIDKPEFYESYFFWTTLAATGLLVLALTGGG